MSRPFQWSPRALTVWVWVFRAWVVFMASVVTSRAAAVFVTPESSTEWLRLALMIVLLAFSVRALRDALREREARRVSS